MLTMRNPSQAVVQIRLTGSISVFSAALPVVCLIASREICGKPFPEDSTTHVTSYFSMVSLAQHLVCPAPNPSGLSE